jgi:hypothetical protein
MFIKWLFALVVLTGCTLQDVFDFAPDNTRITTVSFDGVIFDAANAEDVGLWYEFNDPIIGYWTPTEPQIYALEGGLEGFLEAERPPEEYGYDLAGEVEFYRRQYFGVMFTEGQPLIYANFFCADDFDYWLESFVLVMDGGECFFQLLYDPATGQFSNLRVNGYA